MAPGALIVGCGYLGRRVAALLLDRGLVVFGTVRRPSRARELAALGVRPLVVSVTESQTMAALEPALVFGLLDVYYLVPPGRPGYLPLPEQVLTDGLANVLGRLAAGQVRRGVLASSTAVYGQRGGTRVDAQSPAKPSHARGRSLLEAESRWLAAPIDSFVVRLAGLYGPDRIIGLAAVRDGAPIVGDPQAMLNLIHADDAATLLIAVMEAAAPARIELGCDGCPCRRIDYYRYLARCARVSDPVVVDDVAAARQMELDIVRLNRISSKVCDNGPMRRRTGWEPRYADFRAGLADCLPDLV